MKRLALHMHVIFIIIVSMFLCICNAVSIAEVQTAIAQGATTREAVTKSCNAGGDCGSCHADIERMIKMGTNGLIPAVHLGHRAA